MIRRIFAHVRSFCVDEEGTTAVEYAAIAALIAATCMASILALSQAAAHNYDSATAVLGN